MSAQSQPSRAEKPTYVIMRPCIMDCGERHPLYAAVVNGERVGWGTRKAAEQHRAQLAEAGWVGTEEWEVAECAD